MDSLTSCSSKMSCLYPTSISPHWYLEEHGLNGINIISLNSSYLAFTTADEPSGVSGPYTDLKQVAAIVMMVEIVIAAAGIILHYIKWWKLSSHFTTSAGDQTSSPAVVCLRLYSSLVGYHHQHRVTRERLPYIELIGILQHCFYMATYSVLFSKYGMALFVPQGARSPPAFSEYDMVRTSMEHYNYN